MRKVLFILGQLKDSDVEWLAKTGVKRALSKDEVLISAGKHPDSIYILLEGELIIVADGIGVINELQSGEIVGEMSFVDSAPPQVNVIAGEGSVVLQISRRALESKIKKESEFGLRFYRALSIFLADRLRGTVNRLGYESKGSLDDDSILNDELDDVIMDNVSQAGERFNRMLKTLANAKSH